MSSQEAKVCTWADFSLTDAEKLLHYPPNSERVRQVFLQKLAVDNIKQCKILLDLYTYTLMFGKKQDYSPAQLSTLLSIVKRLHAKCTSTARENLDEVLTYFQEMMVRHSVNRPPFSLCIFSPCQVKSITEYILSTYFKHFKFYKYAFTKRLHLNVSLAYADEEEEEPKLSDHIMAEESIATEALSAEVTEQTALLGPMDSPTVEVEPAKSQLKELISRKLDKIVEQQQVKLQTELMAQESRLLSRITALETALEAKRTLTNNGKKRSGKAH